LGSLVVGISSAIITFSVLAYINGQTPSKDLGIYMILFIGFITGILSAFIELVGSKGVDNLTLPIGSGIFATLSYYFNSIGLFIYLFISIIILIFAYRRNSISHDGIVAAILTAICLYSLGGPYLGSSLLVFF